MGENVVGLLSIPREFRISYSPTLVRNVTFRGLEDLAAKHGIPLTYVTKKMNNPEYVAAISALRPDFGLVVGWYHMIPRVIRDLFPKGVAGVHASLLPKYRGGAPLVWAMINGQQKTGVTLFYFADGVDTGDIIAQKVIEISCADTIREVYEKASVVSADLVRELVPLIRQGKAPRCPQNHALATQFPQRKPEDGLIDWTQPAEQIRNFIRAQTKPYPGAFTCLGGKKVIIWDADILQGTNE
jgi:methionyl-tRNA formyltransferase